jgi:hypothetical protein
MITRDENGRPPAVLCVLCGLANAAYRHPDGAFVVPLRRGRMEFAKAFGRSALHD